jgi:hypothetical protein
MTKTQDIAKALMAGAILAAAHGAHAQELEPRAYAPSPVGTTFYIIGAGKSDGGILLDPSLDVGNVEADYWYAVAGIGHTFDLFGQQARILAVLPYVDGTVEGDVGLAHEQRELRGIADPRIKFSIGLFGSPALSLDQFGERKKDTAIGVSLTIMPPLGQYDSDQLINVGYNRWAFKPEIGVSHTIDRWTLEASAGVWLFTDNDDYAPGSVTRTQDPVTALQGHVGYNFDGGAWIAANATWFAGGETETNGIKDRNRQDNVRLGLTLSLPLGDGQSVKFTYATGSETRRGSDVDTFAVTWQLVEF